MKRSSNVRQMPTFSPKFAGGVPSNVNWVMYASRFGSLWT